MTKSELARSIYRRFKRQLPRMVRHIEAAELDLECAVWNCERDDALAELNAARNAFNRECSRRWPALYRQMMEARTNS